MENFFSSNFFQTPKKNFLNEENNIFQINNNNNNININLIEYENLTNIQIENLIKIFTECQTIIYENKKNDWMKIFDSLTNLRKIQKFYGKYLISTILEGILFDLNDLIKNSNQKIQKNILLLLTEYFNINDFNEENYEGKILFKTFKIFFDDLIKITVSNLSNNIINNSLAQQSFKCLDNISQNLLSINSLNFILKYFLDKNLSIERINKSFEIFCIIFNNLDEIYLNHVDFKEIINNLIEMKKSFKQKLNNLSEIIYKMFLNRNINLINFCENEIEKNNMNNLMNIIEVKNSKNKNQFNATKENIIRDKFEYKFNSGSLSKKKTFNSFNSNWLVNNNFNNNNINNNNNVYSYNNNNNFNYNNNNNNNSLLDLNQNDNISFFNKINYNENNYNNNFIIRNNNNNILFNNHINNNLNNNNNSSLFNNNSIGNKLFNNNNIIINQNNNESSDMTILNNITNIYNENNINTNNLIITNNNFNKEINNNLNNNSSLFIIKNNQYENESKNSLLNNNENNNNNFRNFNNLLENNYIFH